jgi:hypothetical protein
MTMSIGALHSSRHVRRETDVSTVRRNSPSTQWSTRSSSYLKDKPDPFYPHGYGNSYGITIEPIEFGVTSSGGDAGGANSPYPTGFISKSNFVTP